MEKESRNWRDGAGVIESSVWVEKIESASKQKESGGALLCRRLSVFLTLSLQHNVLCMLESN